MVIQITFTLVALTVSGRGDGLRVMNCARAVAEGWRLSEDRLAKDLWVRKGEYGVSLSFTYLYKLQQRQGLTFCDRACHVANIAPSDFCP